VRAETDVLPESTAGTQTIDVMSVRESGVLGRTGSTVEQSDKNEYFISPTRCEYRACL
jgi:hypothetical protein